MAVWHDAYLFDPSSLRRVLELRIGLLLDSPNGYAMLRADALALMKSSSKVRSLADRYGSWDIEGASEQYPNSLSFEPEDAAFWLTFFVYDLLEQSRSPLGLGGAWRELKKTLGLCGWEKPEIDRLIHGRPFNEIFETSNPENDPTHSFQRRAEILKLLRPQSQNGLAGWIGKSDVPDLLGHLEHSGVCIQNSLENHDLVTRAYESAVVQLSSACERGMGLCTIISG